MNNYLITEIDYSIRVILVPKYLNIDDVRLFLTYSKLKNEYNILKIITDEKIHSKHNTYELSYIIYYRDFYINYNGYTTPHPNKLSFKYLTDEIADYFLKDWGNSDSLNIAYRKDFEQNFKKYRNESIIKNIIK